MLPHQVELGHAEQGFGLSVGVNGFVPKRLAAQVHVWHHRQQPDIVRRLPTLFHLLVGLKWPQHEVLIDQNLGPDRPLHVLGKDEPQTGLVGRRDAVGNVMDLQIDMPTGRNLAPHSGRQ